MVRPNQIIRSDLDNNRLTFLMFARSESQVKRRVLLLNFPSVGWGLLTGKRDVDSLVTDVRVVSEGIVNRYAVTVDTDEI